MSKKQFPSKAKCTVCCIEKPATGKFWNDEHIIPAGFGNAFQDTKCKLPQRDYLLCRKCNEVFNWFFDEPFLKWHQTVEIREETSMQGRAKSTGNLAADAGAAFIAGCGPLTVSNYLLECLKIAFESHLKFLSVDYRDNVFCYLQQLMSKAESVYNSIVTLNQKIRTCTAHGSLLSWWSAIINPRWMVLYPEEIFINEAEISDTIQMRSNTGEYASLVFILPNTTNKCVLCAIYLQSLPPVVVRISNSYDRFISEYGTQGQHIMDLRTAQTWVGFENGTCSIPYTSRISYEREIKRQLKI